MKYPKLFKISSKYGGILYFLKKEDYELDETSWVVVIGKKNNYYHNHINPFGYTPHGISFPYGK